MLTATFDIAKSFDDLQLAHKKEVYCTIVTAQVGTWGGLHWSRIRIGGLKEGG